MQMELESGLIEDLPYKYKVAGTAEPRIHLIDIKADIFKSRMQTLVCPVNCKGVMGAGLAKQFAIRYPGLRDAYEEACNNGDIKPGEPEVFDFNGRLVVCFPTKDHWATNSPLQFIHEGLDFLVKHKQDLGIISIAFPMLGCGLGKLPKNEVFPVIYDACLKLEVEAEIYLN